MSDATTYSVARYVLSRAASAAVARRTPHEGLFDACSGSLRWLDPAIHLPRRVRGDFERWASGLLPKSYSVGDTDSLIASLRRLDSEQAQRKVNELVVLAGDLRRHCSLTPAPRISTGGI